MTKDLAGNHAVGEFLSFSDKIQNSNKKQLSQFPDIFYVPVHANHNKSDYKSRDFMFESFRAQKSFTARILVR